MKQQAPFILPTTLSRNSSTRSLLRRQFCLVALSCFGLLSAAVAVNPPPDGGYPNGNTAEGTGALFNLNVDAGLNNTAVGFDTLYSNTSGSGNTANGSDALYNNNGIDNSGFGWEALYSNVNGSYNTACGAGALFSNKSGNDNTAIGLNALNKNTTGSTNIAVGEGALFNNISGGANVAVGYAALSNSKTPNHNIAIGFDAQSGNSSGGSNVAIGTNALYGNNTGIVNTVIGDAAGFGIKGDRNIAVGANAGKNLTTGSYNLDIGNVGVAGESGTIRIGTAGHHTAAFMAGIYGVPVAKSATVIIDANGHLGTATSSMRFKDDVKPMDKASEAILKLNPVTFRYKKNIDPDKTPQFGLIAEEVEKVAPELVGRDEAGTPYTVRYEAVSAMLLNEFLKEHHKVVEQQAVVSELKSIVTRQQKQIDTLNASLQRVSDQVQTRQQTLLAGD